MSDIQLPRNTVPLEPQPLLHVNNPATGMVTIFSGSDTGKLPWSTLLSDAGAYDIMRDTEINIPNGLDWLRFTVPDQGNLVRMAIVSDTSQSLVFYGLLLPSNSPAALQASITLHNKISEERGKVFENAIKRCHLILADVDLYDDESKSKAKDRLADIFSIFSSMSETLIKELSRNYIDDADVIGFLLMDVLVSTDNLKTASKVDIISTYTANAKASVRYEAVRALDFFNAANIRPLLQNMHQGETNPEVKGLLEASLRTAT